MNRIAAILCLAALGLCARAQVPNLAEGVELWRGRLEDRDLRLWQIPRKATALVPLRFVLEEVSTSGTGGHPGHAHPTDCPDCRSAAAGTAPAASEGILDRLEFAEIRASGGKEALLAYPPTRHALHLWGDRLAEVREILRTPGTYRLTFASDRDSRLRVSVPIRVGSTGYLNFGLEFGWFVVGCLTLGLILIAVVIRLGRRLAAPAAPAP
jgi:hypothetical protein